MTLRDYQIDISDRAAVCLKENKIAYLCCETRTGKTIIAFETIRKHGAKNVLFVTKKKAIKSIETDYQHFKNHFACTVINYESVSKCKGGYDLIVCDEAHSLGAFPKPAKRVKDLLSFTRSLPIIYLSATATPESFSQIYHQFYISSFSPFREYKSFYRWAKNFVTVKKLFLYNREVNDYSNADQDKIEQWAKHLFFTQTQKDSGFSEVIKEKVLTVPMSQVQKAIHDTLLRDRVVYGQSGAVVLGDSAVKLQNKIHQICSGTIKDEDGNGHVISKIKGEYIKEYFVGRKIVVFYKFIAEFEMLKQVFGEGRWTDSPEVFQQSDDKVFLGQFQSSREGIRLDTADAIVFITPDFSYLSYEQSRNRIMSKERTKDATLYWVFSEGGIEGKIYRMVTNKKDFTLRHFKTQYHVRSNVQSKSA